jgi:hypothetical protein
MMDFITYCNDVPVLISELQEKAPQFILIDENGNALFLVDKTMTIRNGNETLSLIRGNNSIISLCAELTSISVLGSYDDVFNDPEKLAIYNRVYDQEPKEHIGFDGSVDVITPPRKFCIFAD